MKRMLGRAVAAGAAAAEVETGRRSDTQKRSRRAGSRGFFMGENGGGVGCGEEERRKARGSFWGA
jgi:hypothetical protein